MNTDLWNETVAHYLGARFGTAVEVKRPKVDWDGRAACRAILPGRRRPMVQADLVVGSLTHFDAGRRPVGEDVGPC